jgi:stalled ribosome rescue protein Dom34
MRTIEFDIKKKNVKNIKIKLSVQACYHTNDPESISASFTSDFIEMYLYPNYIIEFIDKFYNPFKV